MYNCHSEQYESTFKPIYQHRYDLTGTSTDYLIPTIYLVELNPICQQAQVDCLAVIQSLLPIPSSYSSVTSSNACGFIGTNYMHMIATPKSMQLLSSSALSGGNKCKHKHHDHHNHHDQHYEKTCLHSRSNSSVNSNLDIVYKQPLIVHSEKMPHSYKISANLLTVLDSTTSLRVVPTGNSAMELEIQVQIYVHSIMGPNSTHNVGVQSVYSGNSEGRGMGVGDISEEREQGEDGYILLHYIPLYTPEEPTLLFLLEYLAKHPLVVWIEYNSNQTLLMSPQEEPIEFPEDQEVQENQENQERAERKRMHDAHTPYYLTQVTGTGHTVGIIDTGLDISSCYFYDVIYDGMYTRNGLASRDNVRDEEQRIEYDEILLNHRKIVYYGTVDGDGIDNHGMEYHGTHVCGIAAGYSHHRDGVYGHAPGAKIAFWDSGREKVMSISSLTRIWRVLYSAGARVMSNSWACASDHSYSVISREVDKFMIEYPEVLILFGAGNNGPGMGSCLAPGTNKNGLTVGAHAGSVTGDGIDSHPCVNLCEFSARGPTSDGRMKPEVLGPGYSVPAAQAMLRDKEHPYNTHCGVTSMSGTSMATPAVAGDAVLIRDYFLSGYYPTGRAVLSHGFVASGALLKAMIIHSTNLECLLGQLWVPQSHSDDEPNRKLLLHGVGYGLVNVSNYKYDPYPLQMSYYLY